MFPSDSAVDAFFFQNQSLHIAELVVEHYESVCIIEFEKYFINYSILQKSALTDNQHLSFLEIKDVRKQNLCQE